MHAFALALFRSRRVAPRILLTTTPNLGAGAAGEVGPAAYAAPPALSKHSSSPKQAIPLDEKKNINPRMDQDFLDEDEAVNTLLDRKQSSTQGVVVPLGQGEQHEREDEQYVIHKLGEKTSMAEDIAPKCEVWDHRVPAHASRSYQFCRQKEAPATKYFFMGGMNDATKKKAAAAIEREERLEKVPPLALSC